MYFFDFRSDPESDPDPIPESGSADLVQDPHQNPKH